MHELERLQAKRAGQPVPVPEVVDVDINAPEPAEVGIGGTRLSEETKGNQQ